MIRTGSLHSASTLSPSLGSGVQLVSNHIPQQMFTSLFLHIWLYLCLLLGWLCLLKVFTAYIITTVSQARWTWPVKPQPGQAIVHVMPWALDPPFLGNNRFWCDGCLYGFKYVWVGLLRLVTKFFPEVVSCWRRQLDSTGYRGIHLQMQIYKIQYCFFFQCNKKKK